MPVKSVEHLEWDFSFIYFLDVKTYTFPRKIRFLNDKGLNVYKNRNNKKINYDFFLHLRQVLFIV